MLWLRFLVSECTHVFYIKTQQWFTSVSHTHSWLCYFLLWDRKWRSHPGRGGKWVRDRDRLFIFCPITSQLRVWDTDVNHCCGVKSSYIVHNTAEMVSNMLLFSCFNFKCSFTKPPFPFLEDCQLVVCLFQNTVGNF